MKWGIDTSAGRPILVYEGCSVIEAEQAEYVMGLIRAHEKHQRQGADSPASATTDPSADQTSSPPRNNAVPTVGALQEATETPGAQSAPATFAEATECTVKGGK